MEFVSLVVVGWSFKALGRKGENLISFFWITRSLCIYEKSIMYI